MRGLVMDQAAPGMLRFTHLPDPRLKANQVLVRVSAISLNRGEVRDLRQQPAGAVPGWDAAGTVVQTARDNQGLCIGTRVVTNGWGGAWAELRAVDLDSLAVVPKDVDLGEASALPVAGVTALRALQVLGDVRGKRVMVTGASGGVGRFAVQLAHLAGARVVAVVGRPERAVGLKELGAEDTVVGTGVVPVEAVLEAGGGASVQQGLQSLSTGGTFVAISADAQGVRSSSGNIRVMKFGMNGHAAPDLAELLQLMVQGQLQVQVGWRGNWSRVGEAAKALLDRKVDGKAVLEVT